MESGTLDIYHDLLTSLSVITLGNSMPNLLDANNRRNFGRDSDCAFCKERASAYLDDSIERSSRTDSKNPSKAVVSFYFNHGPKAKYKRRGLKRPQKDIIGLKTLISSLLLQNEIEL